MEVRFRDGSVHLLRTLLDSGTSATMLLRKHVEPGRISKYKGNPVKWTTLGGVYTTKRKALMEFRLPEFSLNKTITWSCHVDETTDPKFAQYDMIIGDDLMQELGIDLLYSKHLMVWENNEVAMKNRGLLKDTKMTQHIYRMHVEDSPIIQKAEARKMKILDADYSAVDLAEHCNGLKHLDLEAKNILFKSLSNYPELFSGGLGKATGIKPIHLELKSDATPYHIKRAFTIPQCYMETTKKEIDRLCRIGVLEKNSNSEWGCGTFIRPKKTGDVRVCTDFRELNKHIKRKAFPIPKISELLQSLAGFKTATALDLSMGYYHIPLDEESQQLCSFVMPWGKYRYKRLPMGIKVAVDVFQEVMTELFSDLDYVRVYLDDILIVDNGSLEDHMHKVSICLGRLEKAGFKANVRKSLFAVEELEYLGFWLTRTGIQPQPKKVEAISRLTPPKTTKQLRRFLGMVNFYRDMWKGRSHILAPLTELASNKKPFQWKEEQQKAFELIKKIMGRETLLSFPDFSKPFHIYADASDYQLGSVIMQDEKPLAFYSRKLNSAQRNYTTGEQELLSIVETLKEFKNILLGQRIIVHTDHKNLLYKNLSTERLSRWRMLVEEYDVEFVHIKGVDNVVADGLSRLDADYDTEVDTTEITQDEQGLFSAYCMARLEGLDDEQYSFNNKPDVYDMAEAFILESEETETDFPIHPPLIKKYQDTDKKLKLLFQRTKGKDFSTTKVENVELITFQGKIYMPEELQSRVVAWYHEYLAHPGEKRTEETIHQWFNWTGLRRDVRAFCKTCKKCQLSKKARRKYGHLQEKEAESDPWTQVHIDLVGPWAVQTPSGTRYLSALTCIDPATGWFEMIEIPDKTAESIMEAFNDIWLCRYPRPQMVRFDNGNEFKAEFMQMCRNYGLKGKPTSTYNPQSNGIIERIHLVIGNMLRTFEDDNSDLPSIMPFRSFISAAAWAIRSTYHTTLQATPGQLVFGRDMLLSIPFRADWARIKLRKQGLINKGVLRENASRIQHEYKVNDLVLLDKPGILRKSTQPRTGPHTVTKIYKNSTVQIKRGAISERVTLRRLTPYFS